MKLNFLIAGLPHTHTPHTFILEYGKHETIILASFNINIGKFGSFFIFYFLLKHNKLLNSQRLVQRAMMTLYK